MKALDIISAFDRLRPNSFEFDTKKSWLITLETNIRSFHCLHTLAGPDLSFANEENPDLLLGREYTGLYVYYLISMADLTNGEYKLYNVSSMYFNSLFDKWKRAHRAKHMPEKNIVIKQ